MPATAIIIDQKRRAQALPFDDPFFYSCARYASASARERKNREPAAGAVLLDERADLRQLVPGKIQDVLPDSEPGMADQLFR